MKYINLIYDNEYEDVDILAIPDDLSNRISEIAQEYLDWIPPDNDKNGWAIVNGKKYLAKETVGFVEWLNNNFCLGAEKAQIVLKNTQYCKKYEIVEF